MTSAEKEELIIKINDLRLNLKKYRDEEYILEVIDLLDTIMSIIIKK